MNNLSTVFKDPAKRCAFIFNQEMKPCPKCQSYNIKNQTPIKMEEVAATDSPRQILGKWARASKGVPMMDGPVFIMCFDCGHKGPAVDCTGRTRDDVGQDAGLAKEVRRLWNEQVR